MTFEQILFAFPIVVLANWQLVETWHHGSIFEQPRAWLEAHRGSWWADLMLCPFCLSHWTGAGVTILMFATMQDLNSTYAQFAMLYALAVTRLPQVFNDLGYSYWRKHSIDTSTESSALNQIANSETAVPENPLGTDQRKDLENS